MAQRGKKYLEAAKLVDRERAYSPREAIELAQRTSYVSFDATVEVHLRMGLDVRHADQQVRAVASLPHGLGKKARILVFTQGESLKIAEEAGAEFVGGDELIKKVEGGWFDFDVAIASPDMMGKVGRLGRLLGRRGLMPNPKSGTVAPPADLARVIREAQRGRLEFRTEKTALIHAPIGKVSFPTEKLLENLGAFIEAVMKARPSGAKGHYIKAITLTTTMGPGIKLDMAQTLALAA